MIIQDVLNYENAIVDNTCINDRKVILTDESKPYVQRFFTENDDSEIIEACKTMRKIGIKTF